MMMTLDEILQELHAMRQNLLVFERKYGVPSELFFEAYQNGEEPADSAWVWIGLNGRQPTKFCKDDWCSISDMHTNLSKIRLWQI
ncbi:MAG: hypothetical protein R3E79_30145 [Caldilineaceae bacterium]